MCRPGERPVDVAVDRRGDRVEPPEVAADRPPRPALLRDAPPSTLWAGPLAPPEPPR